MANEPNNFFYTVPCDKPPCQPIVSKYLEYLEHLGIIDPIKPDI